MNTFANEPSSPTGSVHPFTTMDQAHGTSWADVAENPSIATQRRLDANRANGRKGGPKTAAGKAKSRMNSLKHGVFSRDITISTSRFSEDPREYRNLLGSLVTELAPTTTMGMACVQEIANTYVRLARLDRFEKAVIENGLVEKSPEEIDDESLSVPPDVPLTLKENAAKAAREISNGITLLINHSSDPDFLRYLDKNVIWMLESKVIKREKYTLFAESLISGSMDQKPRGVLSRLSWSEAYNYLRELLEEETANYRGFHNTSVRRIKYQEKKILWHELALVPSAETLQLIVRYRAELHRTIKTQLEQFWQVEDHGRMNRDLDDSGIDDSFESIDEADPHKRNKSPTDG